MAELVYAVSIYACGRPPRAGWCCSCYGISTWCFVEERDALEFARRLLERGGRSELRRDHVFAQLGLEWVLVLSARVDGEDADALAWQVAYRGALERGEQLRVGVLP